MKSLSIQLEESVLRKVLKRLHFPLDVMLLCVRWYAAYALSLRDLEEMMAERGVQVDHATVHQLGAEDFAGIGQSVSPSQAPSWSELADGRNLHSSRWAMEVSVSRC